MRDHPPLYIVGACALVVVTALGCGGAGVAAHEPASVHPIAACPAAFADAQRLEGGTYGARGHQGQELAPVGEDARLLACPYPEGECRYVSVTQVGGCSECYSTRNEWRCHSDTVPRPDGCPYAIPDEGSTCGEPGRACAYTADPSEVRTATCTDGAWQHESVSLPDPM